ncbi:MAG: ribbon-helix-helix domain-containing protein [Pseudomonadota bacterium]
MEQLEAPSPSTHQRIVQADRRRYSLRLEPEFWAALDWAAARSGVRLGRLVGDIAAGMPPGGNLAARLRAYCLMKAEERGAEAERRAERAELAAGATDIAALLEACPAPCLVMSREGAIGQINAAFGRWFGPGHAALIGRPFEHFLSLRATRTRAAILAEFDQRTRAWAPVHVIYVAPGRVVAAPAGLMPVARQPAGGFSCLVMIDAR